MKTRSWQSHDLKIPPSRWLAYAGAGAATALIGAVLREIVESWEQSGKQIDLLRSDRRALRSQNVFLNFAGRSFR